MVAIPHGSKLPRFPLRGLKEAVNRPLKKFDCVEMKRRGAKIVQKEIAGMTQAQELEYWKKRTDAWKKEMAEKKNARENSEVKPDRSL